MEYADQLKAETRRQLSYLQSWISRGLIAPVSPHHLLLTIGAATQTCVNSDWQAVQITGHDLPDDSDYESAAATLTRLVMQGTNRVRVLQTKCRNCFCSQYQLELRST